MTTDRIDYVAAAILVARRQVQGEHSSPPYDQLDEESREALRAEARAAIERACRP